MGNPSRYPNPENLKYVDRSENILHDAEED